MKNKEILKVVFSWFLKIVIFIIFCYTLFIQNILVAIAAGLALLFSVAPIFLAKNYGQHLPLAVDLPVTVALLLHTIGLTFDLYHLEHWWWWDIMTHFLGTVAVACLAFLIVYSMRDLKKIKTGVFGMALFTFFTALAIGALWEIGEFYFDHFFKTNSLRDIVDTIQDLQFDALGGLLVAFIGARYVNSKEDNNF